jgi:hypothetical protein
MGRHGRLLLSEVYVRSLDISVSTASSSGLKEIGLIPFRIRDFFFIILDLANRSFGIVVHFRYWRTTVTNQNFIQEEIKSRLNSGNACYHSVQNISPSRLLPQNAKIWNIQNYNFACGSVWM